MPRPCITCGHSELRAINAALVSGTPRVTVARRFGLSEPAVRRHFHLHLPESLRLASEAERFEVARELRATLRLAVSELGKQFTSARDRRRTRAMLRAARRLYPLARLQAELLGRGGGR